MGTNCCKYSPTDNEKADLIHILKTKPNIFEIIDIRIFEYYRKYQTKFKKLLDEHLTITELTLSLSYLLSLKHIKDTKKYKLNMKHFNLIKKNNYKRITMNLMSDDDTNNLNDFLFILFIYEISLKNDNDYDTQRQYHNHSNSPIIKNQNNNFNYSNKSEYGTLTNHHKSKYGFDSCD